MGRLTAAFYDRFTRGSEEACLRRWRADLLRSLSGEGLEVGAGTGHNLPHYPEEVRRLVLTEPDPHMRRRLAGRIPERHHHRTEVGDASIEALPFPDRSFDFVVGTLVLCSVPGLDRSVREVHRVLRPGGRFVFLEHVAAEDRPGRLKWQRRVEPIWKRVSGNCHLTRRSEAAIRDAGFEIVRIERESMRKAWPLIRPTIRGVARKSGEA